ncbi:ABC transporter permease [Rhodococcus sp. 14-2470-1a]|nr:ABC transporter permease [Rhodococcus sp. 06-418-1B]OZE82415.1 ABC transporter permease [Rhodococcus sp. 15-649-1-2]OZF00594.1 ABC transporter permease [Rhodococcus sp. 15-1189-1-1a]OZF06205.1 ABC transporter permease [Rhodococcus sp. 15-1154-1]OZF14474.1 ABC transporter permease [Rhodococcus sp. 14-2686-1-2]OZF48810.1 ABC transporter permease [Rhodococcus sp. 14-2470-1a]OZF52444.1 ABC transporter permease [Rhodococcus sp. 14-2470-1b]
MLVVLVLLVVVATFLYDGFLAPANIRDILVQNAAVGIIAVGMTFVIISGGFDLSVGATYALGSTVFAGVTISTGSVALAGAAALAAGLLCGLANGLLVAKLHINPFVATLGSASVISGLAYIYSNSAPFIVSQPGFQALSKSHTLGIPTPIFILILTMVVGGIVLAKTTIGRNVQAVGGNTEAGWLSGLRVPSITASVYVLTGALAAIAGMIDASRLAVGQADVGANIALDAIAIVVVGGTSLRGGEGAMWRSAVGLLILATLTNVFYSLNVSQHWQLIAKGLIVIAAVALDSAARRRS